MKNRKLLLFVSIVLATMMSLGGTLAYLTDTDSDVNTMVLGNVDIEQHEYQRAEGVSHINAGAKEGDLVPFVQGQTLLPAVPKTDDAYEAEQDADECFHWGVYSDGWNGLWDDDNLANVMDKFVFVENTGKSDAYYRTIIALECPEGMTIGYASEGAEIEANCNGNTRFNWDYEIGHTIINGTRYELWCATYTDVLKPGEISRPSLLQIILTHHATNEDMKLLGDTYEILVVTQAVQAGGFESAEVALDTAFGDVTTNSHPWMDGEDGDQEPNELPIPVIVDTAEKLTDAIAGNEDAISLGGNIDASEQETSDKAFFPLKDDKDIVLDLNGKTLKAANRSDAAIRLVDSKMTIKGDGAIEFGYALAILQGKSTLTIESGRFYRDAEADCNTDNTAFVVSGAREFSVFINGGYFDLSTYDGNCGYGDHMEYPFWDADVKDATIVISGGQFVDWNPNPEYLAEGATVTEEVVDGKTIYTVTK